MSSKQVFHNVETDAEGVGVSADASAAEASAPGGDEGHIPESLRRRIGRLEGLRRWALILAALLMIGGYASDLPVLLYSTVLPLLVALLVSYRIKHLEEGRGK